MGAYFLKVAANISAEFDGSACTPLQARRKLPSRRVGLTVNCMLIDGIIGALTPFSSHPPHSQTEVQRDKQTEIYDGEKEHRVSQSSVAD
jgi:fluoride ion exporter CrcB/FEX